MQPELVIRLLTAGSLAGLLLAVGLRLRFEEVAAAVRSSRFIPILLLNFAVVPLACALGARRAGLNFESTTAMIVLGAAPFAPVVPVFARMARADLALAAGFTSIYPLFSALLTPWICAALIERAGSDRGAPFALDQVMLVLVATTTVPLLAGVGIRHAAPRLARTWLRRVELASETVGAASLAYVVYIEFATLAGLTWQALLVTAALFELCLAGGYWLGREKAARRVIGLGTANRNIALALLVAIQSFGDLRVVSAVAGHGLLMILLGLAHVGYWRLRDRAERPRAT
jgi:BASS family bile acid:Na+ symporter